MKSVGAKVDLKAKKLEGGAGKGGVAGCMLGVCNCCCITAVIGNITFYEGNDWNEPVVVIQTTRFTRDYNYRDVHVLTAF